MVLQGQYRLATRCLCLGVPGIRMINPAYKEAGQPGQAGRHCHQRTWSRNWRWRSYWSSTSWITWTLGHPMTS